MKDVIRENIRTIQDVQNLIHDTTSDVLFLAALAEQEEHANSSADNYRSYIREDAATTGGGK